MTPDEVARAVARGEYALLFPGAGTHLPGMARRLCEGHAAAGETLERAEKVTGLPLTHLCRNGSAADLKAPELTHPAVVATSLAAAAALRQHLEDSWTPPMVVGGHSLGHFSALVVAGSLDFDDALGVVAERARLMGEQARIRPAAMISVAGVDPEAVRGWCGGCPADLGLAVIACFNGPRQTVVSGDAGAVDWVSEQAESAAARVNRVPTGVASHSPLMRPVQEKLVPILSSMAIRSPSVPVLVNSSGQPTTDAGLLRADLLGQLEVPVRWHEAVRAVARFGVQLVLDAGPGQAMARTTQWHPGLSAVALNFMQPLEDVVRGA